MKLRNWYLRKKYWLRDFLQGGDMWKVYKECRFIMNHVDEGEEIRKKRLADLLKFACENVPYYRRLLDSGHSLNQISDFPVCNKQIYLDMYEDFRAPIDVIPGQKGDIHIQKTSGSTGTPFEILQDTKCRIRRIALIKAENEIINFHSFEPMCHLRSLKHYYPDTGQEINILWNKNLNIIYIDNSNLTEGKIKEILKTFNDSKAKVIRGYMTTLDTLTTYAVENQIELKYHPTFISVGELLQENLRKRVVEDLHCKIISQYGNEENGIFGSSKINGAGDCIILNRANCFFEILKINSNEPAEEGEIGRLVVTDFTNYAFPMIRYDIGDLGIKGDEKDGILLSIKHLVGRKTDLIYTTKGVPIDLFNSLSGEVYNNPLIKQWQFIQDDEKSYTLILIVKDERLKQDKEHFKDLIKDVVGQDAKVTILYTDEIPVLSSGKRQIVICNYKKQL